MGEYFFSPTFVANGDCKNGFKLWSSSTLDADLLDALEPHRQLADGSEAGVRRQHGADCTGDVSTL